MGNMIRTPVGSNNIFPSEIASRINCLSATISPNNVEFYNQLNETNTVKL